MARYYASVQGRFTSADSVSGSMLNPQTLNLYAYVNNNPLRLIDPTGHEAKDSRNDVSTAGKPSNSAIRRAEWEAQAYAVIE